MTVHCFVSTQAFNFKWFQTKCRICLSLKVEALFWHLKQLKSLWLNKSFEKGLTYLMNLISLFFSHVLNVQDALPLGFNAMLLQTCWWNSFKFYSILMIGIQLAGKVFNSWFQYVPTLQTFKKFYQNFSLTWIGKNRHLYFGGCL